MTTHSYTPEQALELLIQKLSARDESLAAHVQAAIDAGKDVSETERTTNKRRNLRVYRKTVAFSYEEALQVALDALQAYFVEQPLFIDEAADNLAKAALGVPSARRSVWASSEDHEPVTLEQQGDEKRVEIELQTETQITRDGAETLPLKRTSRAEIDGQQRNITQLRTLTDFA